MVLPPASCTMSRTDDEHLQRDIHTNLATTHHPPILQREEFDSYTREFLPNLRRAQNPLTIIILSDPPPGAHPCNPRPGRPNRLVSASHPPPHL